MKLLPKLDGDTPVSVGMLMALNAASSDLPMPKLTNIEPADSKQLMKLKEIINGMTRYDPTNRKRIEEIEQELNKL